MGFAKWFVVLAAGGIGAGVVVAGMTTGKITKYSDRYALPGEHRPAAREDRRSGYTDREQEDYALPDEGYADEGYADDASGGNRPGYGPPRGRMVILDGPGWADDGGPGYARPWRDDRGSDRYGDRDERGAPFPERGERPYMAAPRAYPPSEQRLYQAGPRSYAPQPAAPQTRTSGPAPRDSAADSAARAAGAAADVLAAEREGA